MMFNDLEIISNRLGKYMISRYHYVTRVHLALKLQLPVLISSRSHWSGKVEVGREGGRGGGWGCPIRTHSQYLFQFQGS